MAGTILYKLSLDATQFQKGLNNAMKSLDKAAKNMQKVGESMSKYITVPLMAAGVASVMAWDQSAKALAQVEAGVKSTGGVAGFTADQLAKMATKLTDISRLDDDEILAKLTSQMLTFTNVTGTQFELAQVAAMNLAARLDGDLQSAAIMVGKALNDPIKGLTAMGKAGVQFTASQKETIKALWETGQAAAAQNMILAELEKQYGGSSEATLVGAGKVIQLKNALGNLSEEFGKIIMEGISPFVDFLRDMVKGFMELDEGTKKTIVIVGSLAAAIGPVTLALAGLMQVTKTLAIVFAALNWEVVLVVAAIAAISAAAIYLWQNWQAVSERISDWSWWRNMLVDMAKFLAQTAQGMLDVLTYPIRKMAEMFGVYIPTIVDSLDPLMDKLDLLKTEPKEYKTQFGGFWEAMKNGTKDAAKYFGMFRDSAKKDLAGVGASVIAVTESLGGITTDQNIIDAIDKEKANNKDLGTISPYRKEKKWKILTNSKGKQAWSEDFDNMFEGAKLNKQADNMQVFVERLKFQLSEAQGVVINFGAILKEVGLTAIDGFTDSIQTAFDGGSIKSSLKSFLMPLADLAVRVGKIVLAIGLGIEGIKESLKTLNPVVAVVAGVALIALGSWAKSALNNAGGGSGGSQQEYTGPTLAGTPALAAGGLAYAPTLATVGDNVNAHIDPEVIAPLSKLREAMGFGGSGIKTIRLVATGSELSAILTQEQLRQMMMR